MFEHVKFSVVVEPTKENIQLFKEVYIHEKYRSIEMKEVEELIITFSKSMSTFELMWWFLKLYKNEVKKDIYQRIFIYMTNASIEKEKGKFALSMKTSKDIYTEEMDRYRQIQFQYLMEFYEEYKTYLRPHSGEVFKSNYYIYNSILCNVYYMKWIYANFNVSNITHLWIIETLLKMVVDVMNMDVFDYESDLNKIHGVKDQPILEIVLHMLYARPSWTTPNIQKYIEILQTETLFYNSCKKIIY